MVCPWYINIIGTEPTCLILASATPSYNPCVLPGDNSTHSNFQATTATSRLQKQLWIACMCARAHTHTHSVLHKYTKTKPFIHHLSLSHIRTHPPTHSQLYKCTDTKSFIPSLPHTHLQLHTQMLSLLLTRIHIYTHRDAPPPPPRHTCRQILSLSLMYTLT